MTSTERRSDGRSDRRRVPRGGRREGDLPGRFPCLLVADSYEGVRVPCVRYLNRFGFHVDEAADGAAAIAQISTTRPHVILIESELPNVTVSTLVSQLRDDPGTKTIPIIVMASALDVLEMEGLAEVPLVRVLAKPFALASMLEEVRRLLREQPPMPALTSVAQTASG
jgi:CheY-like chemotaxis protein